MNESEEKWGKTSFLRGLRGLSAYFKNPLGTFSLSIHVLSNCQISEKSNKRAQRYFRTDGRKDGGTDGRDSLRLKRLPRETKNLNARTFRKMDVRTNGRT